MSLRRGSAPSSPSSHSHSTAMPWSPQNAVPAPTHTHHVDTWVGSGLDGRPDDPEEGLGSGVTDDPRNWLPDALHQAQED